MYKTRSVPKVSDCPSFISQCWRYFTSSIAVCTSWTQFLEWHRFGFNRILSSNLCRLNDIFILGNSQKSHQAVPELSGGWRSCTTLRFMKKNFKSVGEDTGCIIVWKKPVTAWPKQWFSVFQGPLLLRAQSDRKKVTAKRSANIFRTLVPLFHLYLAHTLLLKDVLRHLNSFHTTLTELETNLDATSLMWPIRLF